MTLELRVTKRTEPELLERMKIHYSQPKGFVGRSICYGIYHDNIYYGHIIGGSATRFLPGRNEYFNMTIDDLNHVINNIFFNVSAGEGKYPLRNFTTRVLELFRSTVVQDWEDKYQDKVLGFETLVELPRTGETYLRDGWQLVGQTKGYTCKRIAGQGRDSWTGQRVWNTNEEDLKPKHVLVRKI